MRKLVSFSFVATKLILLACFGLMNVSSVKAETPMPCHQSMIEIASQYETKSDCNACVVSEEAWSSQFVQEKLSFILQEVATSHFTLVDELLNTKLVQYINFDHRGPPDDLRILHSHLVAQESILLLI